MYKRQQHVFRNSNGILQLSAIFPNDFYVFLRHGGCAVKHDRKAWQPPGYFLQDIKTQLRLLSRPELKGPMAGADCDGQRINAGTGDELDVYKRQLLGHIIHLVKYLLELRHFGKGDLIIV